MSEFLDGIVVSALIDNTALAIVNLGMPVLLLSAAVALLMGQGGSSLYARFIGEREPERSDAVLSQALLVMVVCGGVLTGVCYAFSGQIARLLTNDELLLIQLEPYVKVLSLSSLAYLSTLGMNYFVIAAGYPKQATVIMIVANVVNITMDFVYILVFGMGVEGAAWATLTGFTVAAVITAVFFQRHDMRILGNLSLIGHEKHFVRIVKIGVPSALGQIGFAAKLIVLNLLANYYAGSDGVVVFALCFQTISLVSCMLVGIVSCVQPIASTLFGERDFEGLRIVMRSASKYLAVSMLAFFFLCELFPVVLTSLYSIVDPALMTMSFHAIRIFSFVHLLRTFVVLFMQYYSVTDHEDVGVALSTEDSFGVLLVAPLLCLVFGIDGIWLSFPLVGAIGCLMILGGALRTNRRNSHHEKGILMLPEGNAGFVLDITIEMSDADAASLSQQVIDFARRQGCRADQANILGVLAEEMTEYTLEHAEKDTLIDVLVRIEDERITMCFRSSGAPLSALNAIENPDASLVFTSGQMLHRLASELEYKRILGLNSTLIALNR